MVKVKQKSIIEILISIPWWVHLFLIAGILLSPSFINEYIYNNPNQILYVINKKIMPEFTWIISGFLFLFMLIQFLSRYKKRKLFFNEYDIEQLKRISWQDFELLVTETFKRDGYKVKEAGGAQADALSGRLRHLRAHPRRTTRRAGRRGQEAGRAARPSAELR